VHPPAAPHARTAQAAAGAHAFAHVPFVLVTAVKRVIAGEAAGDLAGAIQSARSQRHEKLAGKRR
jgi:hypothetical protein